MLDLSEMEIIAKVGELDRANLREGQEVKFVLDAIPDKTFHGKIKGMSGTATANPFGGDPAKKFDVLFSVDMKELMTGLGAKPDQIQKVLETAARNAKKAPAQQLNFPGCPGWPRAGGPSWRSWRGAGRRAREAGLGAGPEARLRSRAAGGSRRRTQTGGRRRSRRGRAGASDEQRAAMFTRMMEQLPPAKKKEIEKEMGGKKMQDLSAEQRNKIFTKLRESSQGRTRWRREAEARRWRRRQRGGGGGEGRCPALVGGFTEAERENAKLPLPPEEDNQLDVLLRPGLLADVEIIIDKVPDAIHVPTQAVFEKDGKQFVYVQNLADNRFEARVIKLAKRSESVMVIAEGLKPNEVVALSDPTAKKNNKNESLQFV